MSQSRGTDEIFVHHETISATLGDADIGVGCYDVIETRDGFAVYEQSLLVETYGSLRSAIAAARRYAEDFDRRKRVERRRRQDLEALGSAKIVTGTFVTLPLGMLTNDVVRKLEAIQDAVENRGTHVTTTEPWQQDFVVSPYRYGLWVRQLIMPSTNRVPRCLARCLDIAREHEAKWILFEIAADGKNGA